MAFKVIRGSCVQAWYPKTASVTLSANFLADFNATGTLTSATISATNIAGIVMVSAASTDTDFASVTSLPVKTPIPDVTIMEADVSGTLTTAMVGNCYDITADGQYVAISYTTTKQVRIVKFISSSKAEVQLTPAAFSS
jgi:hypothetical protein